MSKYVIEFDNAGPHRALHINEPDVDKALDEAIEEAVRRGWKWRRAQVVAGTALDASSDAVRTIGEANG